VAVRPLPAETRVVLYRIAQEALNNITKHAGASQVIFKLTLGMGIMQLFAAA
jgi:signal transduction histidine kinase